MLMAMSRLLGTSTSPRHPYRCLRDGQLVFNWAIYPNKLQPGLSQRRGFFRPIFKSFGKKDPTQLDSRAPLRYDLPAAR